MLKFLKGMVRPLFLFPIFSNLKLILLFICLTLAFRGSTQPLNEADSCCIGNLLPYYGGNEPLKYEGDFFEVKRIIHESFKRIETNHKNGQSGIIVVHFTVTCDGTVTNVFTETFDFNYHHFNMDSQLVDELEAIIKKLHRWIVGQDENGQKYCYHKFLSLKIKNGELEAIFPK